MSNKRMKVKVSGLRSGFRVEPVRRRAGSSRARARKRAVLNRLLAEYASDRMTAEPEFPLRLETSAHPDSDRDAFGLIAA
ncbi:MAG: hypothetical protein Q7T82_11420 [Armatimonadota bacterium]|nr:hypothetical protein [Armatimonadota bacterium]